MPIFLRGTFISSAACGITSKPIKKNGVVTATFNIVLNTSPVVPPTNICPSKLDASPVMAEATTKSIPTPPITVSTVCNTAAVLAPLILIYVINIATSMATASHDAYISKPATVYR